MPLPTQQPEFLYLDPGEQQKTDSSLEGVQEPSSPVTFSGRAGIRSIIPRWPLHHPPSLQHCWLNSCLGHAAVPSMFYRTPGRYWLRTAWTAFGGFGLNHSSQEFTLHGAFLSWGRMSLACHEMGCTRWSCGSMDETGGWFWVVGGGGGGGWFVGQQHLQTTWKIDFTPSSQARPYPYQNE